MYTVCLLLLSVNNVDVLLSNSLFTWLVHFFLVTVLITFLQLLPVFWSKVQSTNVVHSGWMGPKIQGTNL